MIKKTLLIVTLLTVANVVYSQQFGLKAGLNYSNVVPDNGLEYGNYKTGFHAGSGNLQNRLFQLSIGYQLF